MSDLKNKVDLTYDIPRLDYASNEVISWYCEADAKSIIETRRALLEFFKLMEEQEHLR